jgi:hypothetical protein
MDARANPPSDHADVPKSSVGIYRKPHSGTHESVAALVGVQPEFRISLKIGDHGLAGGTIWQKREKLRARRLRGFLPDLSHSRADAALDVNWPRRASIFSFTATVVQEQFLGASSPTPSRAPLFEVLEDFLSSEIPSAARAARSREAASLSAGRSAPRLAPRRNVVADRIPVARNRYRHVPLEEVVGEFSRNSRMQILSVSIMVSCVPVCTPLYL